MNKDLEESMQNLSEEQKEQMRNLHKKFSRKGAFLGFKTGMLFFLSTLVIGFANAFYVHSESFPFVFGAINGLFIGRYFFSSMVELGEEAQSEARSILKK